MMKKEGREKRLLVYVWCGISIGAVLYALSGKPELVVALVATGVVMAVIAIVRNQTWFRRFQNEAHRGRTAKFSAIRAVLAIVVAIALALLLQLIAKFF